MLAHFCINYDELKDIEIIGFVTNPKEKECPNEEGIVFLLYKRYNLLLRKIYSDVYYDVNQDFYDDCVNDLFEYLRRGNPIWSKLANFEWRCSFGTWLKRTAKRRFAEIKPQLIGHIPNFPLSLDDNDEDHPAQQVPDNGVEEYEKTELKAKLFEAISLLEDTDQRFVVLKRLQGYNSEEIAILLQKRWNKYGIIKLNNEGERVKPTAGYVDVRMQRAKANLREIIVKQM